MAIDAPIPAPQREITLRNVKGSALTYAEMDKNLSSFFYSASLSGTTLLLHYTGSTVLGSTYLPTSVAVPLNPLLATIQQLTVAGVAEGDIQYRIDSSTLGANSKFKWDTTTSRVGIGETTPQATLHIDQQLTGSPTTLRLATTGTKGSGKTAYIEFYYGTNPVGTFGKTNTSLNNLYINTIANQSLITTVGTSEITRANSAGLGVFCAPSFINSGTSNSISGLSVQGFIGVGSNTAGNQGVIRSIPIAGQGIVPQGSLPSNSGTTGLLIESPKTTSGVLTGGHVVIGINNRQTNDDYAFSVISGVSGGNYSTPRLTVKADGTVGINNPNPTQALSISGSTTMTGNINIDGTATIVTTADSLGANSKVLTVNGSGLVQYSNNLMPKGGIIMWGGSVATIPTGWTLCDGNVAGSGVPVNGVTIPDLRERFIVGASAGTSNADVLTYQYDRTAASWASPTFYEHTFLYYGSPMLPPTKKIPTDSHGETYVERYTNDGSLVNANGNPKGAYFMYNVGGEYFWYIDYQGKIRKGNTQDWDGNGPEPLPNTFPTPPNWTGYTYFAPTSQYSQQYGWYHVYQKKFTISGTAAGTGTTGDNSWYWIYDKRTQNYSLVRGVFSGVPGDTVSTIYYKTGMSAGDSYTPFQKYTNQGYAGITDLNGQPTKNNARRVQLQGIIYPEGVYNVGDVGGINQVQLTSTTIPSHTHAGSQWSGNGGQFEEYAPTADGLIVQNVNKTTGYVGGDLPHENRPPYYALAFIIYTGT